MWVQIAVWATTRLVLGRPMATGPFGPSTTSDPPTGTATTCARTVPAGSVGVGAGWVGGAEDLVGVDDGVDGAGLVGVPSLLLVGWWVADEVDDAERGDGLGAGVEGADADDALADVVASGELGAGA
jgi:hypothetical protein